MLNTPDTVDAKPLAPLQAVCNYWKEFDLESKRNGMDEVALRIADLQEDSTTNRKKLAESTKEFKRSQDSAINKVVGSLLKQYQEEIDRLTKRARHAESAFTDLYQKLFEAPDPAPGLCSALEATTLVADLEAQVKMLSQELREYKEESQQIKNQDFTIRKLEEQTRQLQSEVEEKSIQLREAQAKAAAEADAAVVAKMREREAQLSSMLHDAQASLASLQQQHHAKENLLFALQSATEEERVSRQEELDLTTAELERAQDRLVALEQEKQSLMVSLQSKGTQKGEGGSGTAGSADDLELESLRSEVAAQRSAASRLRLEVAALRRELDSNSATAEARLTGLRSSLEACQMRNRALEQQLAMCPTPAQVDELKQQVRMLQAVGYNTMDVDDEAGGTGARTAGTPSSATSGASGAFGLQMPGSSSSLEGLLLQKNRRLEHEVTMHRLKQAELGQEMESLSSQLAEAEAALQEKEAAYRRLEEDLLQQPGPSSNPSGGVLPQGGKLTGLLAGSEEGSEGSDPSIVRVLCLQRDRYRGKAQEVSEQLAAVRSQLEACRDQAAAAKADNMALVERLRYVQGFQRNAGGDVEAGRQIEKKYSRIYEEGMNPFKEFQGREVDKVKKELNLIDRAMYIMGQLIYGSAPARLVAFVYLACMHALVFMTLLRMSHHSSSQLLHHQDALLCARHNVTAALHHEHGMLQQQTRLP